MSTAKDWEDFGVLFHDVGHSLLTRYKGDLEVKLIVQDLETCSSECYTKSGEVLLEDVQLSVNDLKQCTDDANQAIQHISNIQDTIALATLVVQFGNALLTRDTGSIVASFKSLKGALENIS